MTPPTDIGKEPPRGFTTTRACTQDRMPDVPVVRASYADYWRRRALAAEGLLRKSRRWRDHDPRCSDHPGNKCLCGLNDHEVSVAAHFASVEGEK